MPWSSRATSQDEGRLFFDSADPLVPGIAAPTRSEQVAGKH